MAEGLTPVLRRASRRAGATSTIPASRIGKPHSISASRAGERFVSAHISSIAGAWLCLGAATRHGRCERASPGGSEVKVVVPSDFPRCKASPWRKRTPCAEGVDILNFLAPGVHAATGRLTGRRLRKNGGEKTSADVSPPRPRRADVHIECDRFPDCVGQENAISLIESDRRPDLGRDGLPSFRPVTFPVEPSQGPSRRDFRFWPQEPHHAVAHGH